FNVILTVTDDKGLQGAVNHTISAEPEAPQPTDTPETPAQPPIAAINGPDLGEVNESLTFDGSASQPGSGGPIVRYQWEFGDGNSDGSGPVVNYTYAAPGSFTVKLTVKDEQGVTGMTEWPVQISAAVEPPPEQTEEAPEPTSEP
ncbi:MAG: PKD domain-containing protein, partial [Chloroflexi bacterium]|nr:PKD domain-containing protein [Chloroflexota bacterium]